MATQKENLIPQKKKLSKKEKELRKKIDRSVLKAAFALCTIILASTKMIFPILSYFTMFVSGYTPGQAGIIYAVNAIAQALGGLILAPLGDRYGLDWMIFFLYPGLAIGFSLCAFFSHNYALFLVGFAIGGFFSDGYGLANAYASLVSFSENDLAKYSGYLETAFGICSALGPILGTAIYSMLFWHSVHIKYEFLLC